MLALPAKAPGQDFHRADRADWVILSACNTAAPDGTPGAEALSGLAKAFFYAGSRALLVSHWPVSSSEAVICPAGPPVLSAPLLPFG